MKLEVSKRKQAKIKMALQGPSGSGKTMSALLLAYGLCSDWKRVAVLDTENYSSSLYSHLGTFSVGNLNAPFSPEKYIEAIDVCEEAGVEVIVIDSISHEWDFLLDYHASLQGNSFTNWAKITPRHNAFVQAILQSNCHVVATIRSKQDYILSERNGKQVPEKVGLKGVTREGIDYEFTVVLDLDMKHNAIASKDRTGLFMDKPEFKITTVTGEKILNWCMEGEPVKKEDISKRIKACQSIQELFDLYELYPQYKEKHQAKFTAKKLELQKDGSANATQSLINQIGTNGSSKSK